MDQERSTSPFSRGALERTAAVISVVVAFAACGSSKSGGPAASSTTVSGVDHLDGRERCHFSELVSVYVLESELSEGAEHRPQPTSMHDG